MNKADFKVLIEELIDKARSLSIDDYTANMAVVEEFVLIASRYRNELNPFVLEHVGQIKSLLSKASSSRRINQKLDCHSQAVNDLISDIRSMEENSFPN